PDQKRPCVGLDQAFGASVHPQGRGRITEGLHGKDPYMTTLREALSEVFSIYEGPLGVRVGTVWFNPKHLTDIKTDPSFEPSESADEWYFGGAIIRFSDVVPERHAAILPDGFPRTPPNDSAPSTPLRMWGPGHT